MSDGVRTESESKPEEKSRYKKIPLELALAAQATYAEASQKDPAQQGKPAQLGLNSGWGGQGR